MGIPTLLLFKDGKVMDNLVGAALKRVAPGGLMKSWRSLNAHAEWPAPFLAWGWRSGRPMTAVPRPHWHATLDTIFIILS